MNSESHGNSREALLNRGFDFLLQGSWAEAGQTFESLLQEDPHNGMACLGKAMADHAIHSRQELAEQWALLRQDAVFQETLKPAEPDFLQWLHREMENTEKTSSLPRFSLPDLSRIFAGFSDLEPGRRVLLSFAGIQLVLLLGVTVFLGKLNAEYISPFSGFFLNLLTACAFAGLPIIFGPVYGNSILRGGRFRRLLKILNNIIAIPGSFLFGILSTACYMSVREPGAQPEDRLYLVIYLLICLIYLCALVFPVFLHKTEEHF